MHILKAAINAVYVPGVLFTPGAAHPVALYSIRKDGAAGCTHCGHRQCEVILGWIPGEALYYYRMNADTHCSVPSILCLIQKTQKERMKKNVIQIWAPLVCYPDWMKCNLGTYLYSSLLLERLEALCFQVICLILQISHKCPLGLINSQNMFSAITQKWKCIW